MLTKEHFAELTIVELLQNIWDYADAVKTSEHAKYWFWLSSYRRWCEECLLC